MIRSRVIIIGANLRGVETELKHGGIRCTELITHCSPLSMIGERDENMIEISGRIDDMPTHLDIKKNLAQMLSKDPANFVQNYNTMPYGKNVDYSNPAEYIIISNTSLAYDLCSNGKYVYTSHSDNEFSLTLKNDATYKILSPTSCGFDWKSLYLKFVETILKEYDSRHIILIKTNPAKYYMDGSDIKLFGTEYDAICDLICEADRFFVEKTNCIEVNEAYNHIPTSFDNDSVVPFAEFDSACVYDISRIIEDIILNGTLPQKCGGTFVEINDVISLCLEYEDAPDKMAYSDKIKDLLVDNNALPIIKAHKLINRNIEFLKGYAFISESLKNIPNNERVYVGVGNHVYIALDPNSGTPISRVVFPFINTPDYKRVINDGYVCSIWEADALCGSLPFYIERARRGDSQQPVRIGFNSKEEFYASLYLIEYPDLVENEVFLIGSSGDEFDTSNHEIKCDLSFFFDPNVKICTLDNGLGDQITYYIFAKRIEEFTGSEIYYDDLIYYLDYIMNDREIDRIIKEDISGRLFSNIFTRRLLLNFKIGDVISDKLAENGLHELTVITNNKAARADIVKKCNKICLCSIQYEYLGKILNCGLYPLYFNYYIRPEWLMSLRPFELREYLEFPKTTGRNKELEAEMLGCDAVAIQVRRGDYVRMGWESNTEFFYDAICKLSQIEDYPNKKYFVFSDDMPWVKEHSMELGLDDAGGEVFYADHNKNEDSLFDMYLISLAKVIIGSSSGFVKMGALYSSRCENYFCSNSKVKKIFEAAGKKNKHDIVFLGESIPDYTNLLALRTDTQRQNSNK